MSGLDRYNQAVLKARLAQQESDDGGVTCCTQDQLRDFIIAEMDAMQAEIDRQHAILHACGLDGAVGQAMLPVKQGAAGLF